MKIVILDGSTINPGDISWDEVKKLTDDIIYYDYTETSQILDRVGDAEYIICNKTKFTKDSIMKLKNVKYIGLLSTGYNIIDIDAANIKGIYVTNIPDYSTYAVAQHTLALLLELTNRVAEHNDSIHVGEWSHENSFSYWKRPLTELKDKNLGIVGWGNIGSKVGLVANTLGMNVYYYSRNPKEVDYAQYLPFNELLGVSDILSLHCPLNETSKELINKETISLMKDGSIILNTSRGQVINEKDLADALSSGKIAYACLDVLTNEPPEENNPLLKLENCILTPHIAWAPTETRKRCISMAVDNLQSFLEGKPINVVNDPVINYE